MHNDKINNINKPVKWEQKKISVEIVWLWTLTKIKFLTFLQSVASATCFLYWILSPNFSLQNVRVFQIPHNFYANEVDVVPVCRVCPGISDPVWDQPRVEGYFLHCSAAVLHLSRYELSLVVFCQDPVLSCLQTLTTKNCHTGVMVHCQRVHEDKISCW